MVLQGAMPQNRHGSPDASEDGAAEHPFAAYVRILGRGPGRSRALTRDEARNALGMVLKGEADPHQVGAFLMLLRYRGEDPDEMAGLVEAARDAAGCGSHAPLAVDLDWPSYGAGRTRGAPWYLLAALALARAGHRILMHGSNRFSAGVPVADALAQLGLRSAMDRAEAARMLENANFAYLPIAALSPGLDRLLGLRELLGLRSPINTVARLVDPCDARAGIDGVFHPPYIALHLSAAERLGRGRLLVMKGGGGEAERTPLKAVVGNLFDARHGRQEVTFPALRPDVPRAPEPFLAVWQGQAEGVGHATVLATIAAALCVLEELSPAQADARAAEIWRGRNVA